ADALARLQDDVAFAGTVLLQAVRGSDAGKPTAYDQHIDMSIGQRSTPQMHSLSKTLDCCKRIARLRQQGHEYRPYMWQPVSHDQFYVNAGHGCAFRQAQRVVAQYLVPAGEKQHGREAGQIT